MESKNNYESNRLRIVKKLLELYEYTQPFSIYLRDYFRNHPEMGARDRREIREWSFNFFRIGKNLPDLSFEKRLAVACFLCSNVKSQSLLFLINTYSDFSIDDLDLPIEKKIEMVHNKFPSFQKENIFPLHHLLSDQVNKDEFYLSFLTKPKVWIRVRNEFYNFVLKELNEKNISFTIQYDSCTLSFEQNVSLEKTSSYQKGFFEIQDFSSQQTREFFHVKKNERWWDACSGSGGKSLLLKEADPGIQIFATDIRENILFNYSERMKKCGFNFFETSVMDLSKTESHGIDKKFDGIIADVPCTGSGTWARSPEWLHKNIEGSFLQKFISQQRNIIKNVIPALKTGSPLIYITCSVFKEENEENIRFFIDNLPLKPEKSAYLKGYNSGADTLFAARLTKM